MTETKGQNNTNVNTEQTNNFRQDDIDFEEKIAYLGESKMYLDSGIYDFQGMMFKGLANGMGKVFITIFLILFLQLTNKIYPTS